MTFIRGPVCKGQIALNVVRDHFWLIFLDPQYDLCVQNPEFLTKHTDLLEMPLVEDSVFELFKATIRRDYRKKASEFARKRQAHYSSDTRMHFDWNYLRVGEEYPPLLAKYSKFEDFLQGFAAVPKQGTSFFSKVADHNANLAYVRIIADKEEDDFYMSIVVNRWHDDVTTVFGEELRLQPEKDSAVLIEGFVGSYPNYFLEVKFSEFSEFFHMLKTYDGSPQSAELFDKFGVNRAREDFWRVYDRFQKKFYVSDPVQAGLFDLNRYHYLARIAK